MSRKIQFFSFSFFDGPRDPLKCVAPTPKMVPSYSLVIWLPKTPSHIEGPSLLHRENLWFSEDTQFWPKYSNDPGVAKSWQISKVTIRCHKEMSQAVLRPNLTKKFQWEVSQIANKERSCAPAIRWFKCKLKPPKNIIILFNTKGNVFYLQLHLQGTSTGLTMTSKLQDAIYSAIWYR